MKNSDLQTFVNSLLGTLKKQLAAVNEPTDSMIVQTSKAKAIVKNHIDTLREFIHSHTFKSLAEEILFFKELKPIFISQYFYYEKLFTLNLNTPYADHTVLETYFNTQLDLLHQFIKTNHEFYKYCLSGATHLDLNYFTLTQSTYEHLDLDKKFSTGYDNLLASIMATELLKEYLIAALKKLHTRHDGQPSLTWTAPKTSLIELLYALHSSAVFNNGKSDLKQIASTLETIFDISLGNYYRVFQDIRLRKNGRTNFLDQLKENFIHRMDEFD